MSHPLSKTLRPARLRLGWSLDDLAAAAQGVVSKQMLSKYEQGMAAPSNDILLALAAALRVSMGELATEPRVDVDFVAFRKHADMPKKEEERVRAEVLLQMRRRRELAAILGEQPLGWRLRPLVASQVADAEKHAVEVRAEWGLGLHPIADLTATLEDEGVEVFVIEAHEKFSGISAWSSDRQPIAVVKRRSTDGARQRMDCAHELGHLVLSPQSSLTTAKEQEDYAARFAGAFLLPETCVVSELGAKRSKLTKVELEKIKQRYGISMQAVVRRAFDTGVLSREGYDFWLKLFARNGRKNDLGPPVAVEQPARPLRQASRAVSEGLLMKDEATLLAGMASSEGLEQCDPEAALMDTLAPQLRFLAMSAEEREAAILEDSRLLAPHYEQHPEDMLPDFYDEPDTQSTAR